MKMGSYIWHTAGRTVWDKANSCTIVLYRDYPIFYYLCVCVCVCVIYSYIHAYAYVCLALVMSSLLNV